MSVKKSLLLAVFLLLFLLHGCKDEAEDMPGAVFLRECGVVASKVENIDSDAIDRVDYTLLTEEEKKKDIYPVTGDFITSEKYAMGGEYNYSFTGRAQCDLWAKHFFDAVLQNTEVNIPENDISAFHFDTKKWGAYITTELIHTHPDYGMFIIDPHLPTGVFEGLFLRPAEEIITRVLAIDALAAKKGISVSEEEFGEYCSRYRVDVENPAAAALARYCCQEDKVLQSSLVFPYLPLQEACFYTAQSLRYNARYYQEGKRGLQERDFVTLNIQIVDLQGNEIWAEDEVFCLYGFGTLGFKMEEEMVGAFPGETFILPLDENPGSYYSWFEGKGFSMRLTIKRFGYYEVYGGFLTDLCKKYGLPMKPPARPARMQ
ncbi:MAG: hypothetical protein IJM50_05545 [Lachnospiraceae bacterium]|nr:hypothetical protein [Lachnospiraceae bacterium]